MILRFHVICNRYGLLRLRNLCRHMLSLRIWKKTNKISVFVGNRDAVSKVKVIDLISYESNRNYLFN